MAGLLDEILENVPDEKPVEPGIYELMVTSIKRKLSKAGNPMIVVSFEIPEEPSSKPIFVYFSEPTDSMDDRTKMSNLRRWKSFMVAVGVDISQPQGEDLFESLKFSRCFGQVTLEDDDRYGPSNRITQFMSNPDGTAF